MTLTLISQQQVEWATIEKMTTTSWLKELAPVHSSQEALQSSNREIKCWVEWIQMVLQQDTLRATSWTNLSIIHILITATLGSPTQNSIKKSTNHKVATITILIHWKTSTILATMWWTIWVKWMWMLAFTKLNLNNNSKPWKVAKWCRDKVAPEPITQALMWFRILILLGWRHRMEVETWVPSLLTDKL